MRYRKLFSIYNTKFSFVEDKDKLLQVYRGLLHLLKIKHLPKEILYDFLQYDFNTKLIQKDPRCIFTYFKKYLRQSPLNKLVDLSTWKLFQQNCKRGGTI